MTVGSHFLLVGNLEVNLFMTSATSEWGSIYLDFCELNLLNQVPAISLTRFPH